MSITTHQYKGYVVSDLHIFSCASLYKTRLGEFFESVSRAQVVVLNGDTFDFKRSIFQSNQETSEKAIAWLRELCARFSATSFYFLLGNHDCNEAFVGDATRLADTLPNLSIVSDSLLLGSSLFLHGDAIDLPPGSKDLGAIRHRYSNATSSTPSKIFAQIVSYSRLNSVEYIRHRKQTLSRKIVNYLRVVHPEKLSQARQVFFGHTHVPFHAFEHQGLFFYNTGSLIRGLRWMPMEFTFEISEQH